MFEYLLKVLGSKSECNKRKIPALCSLHSIRTENKQDNKYINME
jgi:hypothetical protein